MIIEEDRMGCIWVLKVEGEKEMIEVGKRVIIRLGGGRQGLEVRQHLKAL